MVMCMKPAMFSQVPDPIFEHYGFFLSAPAHAKKHILGFYVHDVLVEDMVHHFFLGKVRFVAERAAVPAFFIFHGFSMVTPRRLACM